MPQSKKATTDYEQHGNVHKYEMGLVVTASEKLHLLSWLGDITNMLALDLGCVAQSKQTMCKYS